jgi:hypothetical protein
VIADGPRQATLTSAALTAAFDAPVALEEAEGFLTARIRPAS